MEADPRAGAPQSGRSGRAPSAISSRARASSRVSERAQDRLLLIPPRADHERKPEPRLVRGIVAVEARDLVGVEADQAGGGLLARRFGGERRTADEIGMGANQRDAAVRGGLHRRCAQRGVQVGARRERPRLDDGRRNPGRVFEDGPDHRDEVAGLATIQMIETRLHTRNLRLGSGVFSTHASFRLKSTRPI